jgi:tetratricopeptide (TPR) repeat protein
MLLVHKKRLFIFLFLGLSSLFYVSAWGRNSLRAEAEALNGFETAVSNDGAGARELSECLQWFRERRYSGAVAKCAEAKRLGANGPIEPVAVFIAAESQARQAASVQEIRAVITALEESRRRFRDNRLANWALWRIGSLYQHLGFDHEAIARFEQLLRTERTGSPLLPYIRLDLADIYIAQRRYGPAVRLLQIVYRNPPDQESLGEATLRLGDTEQGLGHYQQARAYYERAEAQWPILTRSRPDSLFAMGDTYLRLGEWRRGLQALGTGYTLYPSDPVAPMMLGRMADWLKQTGRLRQARNFYETILQRHSGTEAELLALMALGELAEAEARAGPEEREVQQAYRAAAIRGKRHALAVEALFHLGQSHQRSGEIAHAVSAYEELLARADSGPWRPRTRQALNAALRSLSASGKVVEIANIYFRHSAMLTTPNMEGSTGLILSETLLRLGMTDPAIRLLKLSLSTDLTTAQYEYGLVLLADAHQKQRNLPGLESAWREYLSRYPEGQWRLEAIYGLVIALNRGGKREEALKVCRDLASGRGSRDASVAAQIEGKSICGELLLGSGQFQAAESYFEDNLRGQAETLDGLWMSYRIAREYGLRRQSAQAGQLFARIAKTDKDPVLAAAAAAQLVSLQTSVSR